jgi:hypothetical protein
MYRFACRMRAWALLAIALGVTLPTRAGAQADAAPNQPALEPTWLFRIAAEGGIGTRSFELPMDGVVYRTDTGLFPVAGVGLEVEHAASAKIAIGVLARYQSSVGLGIVELHTDGSRVPIEVRAHRFEAGVTPTFRFDDEGRWALALCAGYGVLGFRPLLHLVTPAYTLAGPFLRAQLQVPLVSDALRLRAGPEGQWIAQVGDQLEQHGVASSGVGLGGAAALELLLGRHVVVSASYREAWSLLGSSQAQSFKDVARFVTARVEWTL